MGGLNLFLFFMVKEVHEGPREITPNNVMYWSTHYKELVGCNFRQKSLKFLKYNCIKYIGDGKFLVLPLNTESVVKYHGEEYAKNPFEKDYNSIIHEIVNNGGKFECDCNGWTVKEKKNEGRDDGCQCSHVLSLFLAFRCKMFTNTPDYSAIEQELAEV